MHLTLDQLKAVLRFAAEELGLYDQYNSKREFAEKNLSPVDANEQGVNSYYAHWKRDERDLCSAYYVPGQIEFEGPAATPQQFQDGGVVLQHGDSVRGVQTAEFQRTYMLAGRSYDMRISFQQDGSADRRQFDYLDHSTRPDSWTDGSLESVGSLL